MSVLLLAYILQSSDKDLFLVSGMKKQEKTTARKMTTVWKTKTPEIPNTGIIQGNTISRMNVAIGLRYRWRLMCIVLVFERRST